MGSPSCQRSPDRKRKSATRRPSGAVASYSTRAAPFSSVGTVMASRGTRSPRASRRTSCSVTAAATRRATGSSAKTEAGSPTMPTTTSRRPGAGDAQAASVAVASSRHASSARTVPGLLAERAFSDRLRRVRIVGVVRDADRRIEEVVYRGVAADPHPAVEELGVVEAAAYMYGDAVALIRGSARGLAGRHAGHGAREDERGHAERDRRLRQPRGETEELGEGARTGRRGPQGQAGATGRDAGGCSTNRGERAAGRDVGRDRVAERLGAAVAARGMRIERPPVAGVDRTGEYGDDLVLGDPAAM